ncbi:MAG: hypothetical protein M3071_13745 [Actinomycetota bacterium]|nr:hypothetical protein [Actinomycetota bacterium]
MQPLLELGNERGRVEWGADRGVVDVAVLVEVGGQVAFGVAPAARADDPYLAAADRVAQRSQRAQLVRHALHPAVLIWHGVALRGRYDAVQRYVLGRVVGAHAVAVGVTLQQRGRSVTGR